MSVDISQKHVEALSWVLGNIRNENGKKSDWTVEIDTNLTYLFWTTAWFEVISILEHGMCIHLGGWELT